MRSSILTTSQDPCRARPVPVWCDLLFSVATVSLLMVLPIGGCSSASAPPEASVLPPLRHHAELGEPPLPDPLPREPWSTSALAALQRLELTRPVGSATQLHADAEWAFLSRAQALAAGESAAGGEALLRAAAVYALDPRVRAEAWRDHAELLLRRGEPAAAAHAFARYLEQDAERDDGWRVRLWQGVALAGAGRAAEAREVFVSAANEAPPGEPGRLLAYRWAGWLAAGDGDLAAARGLWRRALNERPTRGARDSLQLAIAETHFAEGQWDSVRVALARRQSPRSGEARWELLRGRALLEGGEADSAAATFSRLLERWADAPQLWRDEAHAILAWDALRRGDARVAREHYEQVSGERVEDVPLARYGTALARLQEGDYEGAERLLSPSAPVPPEDPVHYHWAYALAFARFHLRTYGRALEALETFRGRVAADSVGQAAYSLRGDCYFRLARMDEAYDAYAKAAALLSPVPELLLRRQALAAAGSGRWGPAARLLGDLILRYPGTAHAAEYNFWRGEAFYRLGRLGEARHHYQRAERLGADPAVSAYALGWCDYEVGHYADALVHFRRAKRHCDGCPFGPDLALRAGNCLYNLGRVDEAAEAFAEAEDLAHEAGVDGLGQEAAFRLAWTDLRLGEFDTAVERFASIRHAAGRTAIGARALYWEGQALFRKGAYVEASQRFSDLEHHPGASDTLRARSLLAVGDAHFNLGETAAAIDAYRRVLEAPAADYALARSAHESLFECRQLRGEWDEARDLLDELETRFPDAAGLGERHLQLAQGYFGAARYDDALASYADFLERAGADDARLLDVRFQMARCREELGHLGDAARAYQALGDEVDFRQRAEALLRAGVLFLRTSEPEHALATLERRLALDLDPQSAALTRAYLAQAYGEMDQETAAQNEWEKIAHARSGAPDSLRAVAHLNLARLAFGHQQWEPALRRFAAADSLGLSPQVYRARYWAGESALQMGDTLTAIVWLERFLRQGEREVLWEATARFRLAECYEGSGRVSDARSEYERISGLPLDDSGLIEEARARLQELPAGDQAVPSRESPQREDQPDPGGSRESDGSPR